MPVSIASNLGNALPFCQRNHFLIRPPQLPNFPSLELIIFICFIAIIAIRSNKDNILLYIDISTNFADK